MYETFEHTADIGLLVRAPDMETLFVEAGKGFASLVVENPEDVRPLCEREFQVSGRETDYLLFDWLNELLYAFDSQRLLFWEFSVAIGPEGIEAKARGEEFDPTRHRPAHEVKAITYHELCVEQTADGWEARVIVDI